MTQKTRLRYPDASDPDGPDRATYTQEVALQVLILAGRPITLQPTPEVRWLLSLSYAVSDVCNSDPAARQIIHTCVRTTSYLALNLTLLRDTRHARRSVTSETRGDFFVPCDKLTLDSRKFGVSAETHVVGTDGIGALIRAHDCLSLTGHRRVCCASALVKVTRTGHDSEQSSVDVKGTVLRMTGCC